MFIDTDYKDFQSSKLCDFKCYVMTSNFDTTNDEGSPAITYILEMPDQKGKYLLITMMGDQSNRWVLDEIVKSIRWIN
jgi:hypothetical protein